MRPTTRTSSNRPPGPRRIQRRGLTLFELLLALAIFMGSLAALAQLLASGARASAQAKLQTSAILRCESKMGELVAGITPITNQGGGPFDDDPSWSWQLTVSDGPWPNLQQVEVSVSHSGQNAVGNTSYTLRRYVRDPALFTRDKSQGSVVGRSVQRRRSGARPATHAPAGIPSSSGVEDNDG